VLQECADESLAKIINAWPTLPDEVKRSMVESLEAHESRCRDRDSGQIKENVDDL
jgi:hypothetical protein